jgi:hypothetical protein
MISDVLDTNVEMKARIQDLLMNEMRISIQHMIILSARILASTVTRES